MAGPGDWEGAEGSTGQGCVASFFVVLIVRERIVVLSEMRREDGCVSWFLFRFVAVTSQGAAGCPPSGHISTAPRGQLTGSSDVDQLLPLPDCLTARGRDTLPRRRLVPRCPLSGRAPSDGRTG
jgi:hypothetical protein